MLETPRLRPLLKLYQTRNSAVGVAVPKTLLRVLDLAQCIDSNPTIGKGIYAFRDLPGICEFHRDVEPIQYVVSVWRNLLMNSPRTSIAIGKKG